MTDYPARLMRWKLSASPQMTYAQLGEVCGVTGALVCMWMTGQRARPSEADLEALAAALGADGQEVAEARGELMAAKTQRRVNTQRRARWERLTQGDDLAGR
jgi:transcriptional regulator with XRE-family HTH domain